MVECLSNSCKHCVLSPVQSKQNPGWSRWRTYQYSSHRSCIRGYKLAKTKGLVRNTAWRQQQWKDVLRRPGAHICCQSTDLGEHTALRPFMSDCGNVHNAFSDESVAECLATVPLAFGAGTEGALHVEGCSASFWTPFLASCNKQNTFPDISVSRRRPHWLYLKATGLGKVPGTVSLETC